MKQQYEVEDEATFLQQQAADAKVAMQRTLAAMQETAKSAADVRAWTQKYPWYAVGIATVAGFVAARTVLSPAHRQNSRAPTETPAASRSSPLSSVLSWLWGMGRGMLISAIVSAVSVNVAETEFKNRDDASTAA
jgi:hypothetical protein